MVLVAGQLGAAVLFGVAMLFLPTSATVVELGSDNYTSYLQDTLDPGMNVAMEYYAHWCPHCKKFAPTYDLVGSHFMDTVSPKVIVARIDCANHVCIRSLLVCMPRLALLETQHALSRGTGSSRCRQDP